MEDIEAAAQPESEQIEPAVASGTESDYAGSDIDEAALPTPLAVLRCTSPESPDGQECTFFVLGTAHVSRESCDAAAALIHAVQPDLVLLELCLERQPILSMQKTKVRAQTRPPSATARPNPPKPAPPKLPRPPPRPTLPRRSRPPSPTSSPKCAPAGPPSFRACTAGCWPGWAPTST
jgi:hypothetical protein